MSEAAERVERWREEKRKAGYRPKVLWLPVESWSEVEAVAYRRGQDIADCIMTAVRALATSDGVHKPLRLDAQQYQQLKEELFADLYARFFAPEAPVPTLEEVPVPTSVRRIKTGGKRGIDPETLAAIRAEREKHPSLSWESFGQHLFDTGIYKATKRSTGELAPVAGATLYNWLDGKHKRTP